MMFYPWPIDVLSKGRIYRWARGIKPPTPLHFWDERMKSKGG